MVMNTAIVLALVAGVLALVYGGVTAMWILRQPDGNDRMREIAAAVQTGAKAYLNRQYTTIGIVGVVLFVVLGFVLGWTTAAGFAIFAQSGGGLAVLLAFRRRCKVLAFSSIFSAFAAFCDRG